MDATEKAGVLDAGKPTGRRAAYDGALLERAGKLEAILAGIRKRQANPSARRRVMPMPERRRRSFCGNSSLNQGDDRQWH